MNSAWNLWAAQCLVEEFVRYGICQFVIAPGSRSAPLSMAVERHPATVWRTHFDERGAGFLALGLAKGTGKPVAVITTSGSAVANLLPAVVEARQAAVGLVLLTADRPPELIDCGANQAIRQPGIFNHYPKSELSLEPPDSSFDPARLLSSLDRCLEHARTGPVHINCAFREPLYPVEPDQHSKDCFADWPDLAECPAIPLEWLKLKSPYRPARLSGAVQFHSVPVDLLRWRQHKGIIVAGQLSYAEGKAVAVLGERLGWPVFADLHSHCRAIPARHIFTKFGFWLDTKTGCDSLDGADMLLQFGGRLTDKKLQQWIQHKAPREHWLVSDTEYCPDPDHRVIRWINQDIAAVVDSWLSSEQQSDRDTGVADPWFVRLIAIEQQCENTIRTWFQSNGVLSETSICRRLSELLPEKSRCFVGNSLPIRLMDLFANTANVHWFSQRGASGIDGVIAHAYGVYLSANMPTTLILGDLSFLHDLNSLALLAKHYGKADQSEPYHPPQQEMPVASFIIIVLNNNGGNIFRFLPVPESTRKSLFQTPHGLSFGKICEGFGLRYLSPRNLTEFTEIYTKALLETGATVIEIKLPEGGAFEELAEIRRELGQHQ